MSRKEEVMGLVRHILSAGGSLLLANGVVEESLMAEISGAVIALVALGWSVFDKKQARKKSGN